MRTYFKEYSKYLTIAFVALSVIIVISSYITAYNPNNYREETLLFIDKLTSNLFGPMLIPFVFICFSDYLAKFQQAQVKK